MTTVNKQMNLEQYDILYARLDQTAAVMNVLATEDQHYFIGKDNTGSVLCAAEELLRQARDALEGLFVESEAA